jgi:hypothetical protein
LKKLKTFKATLRVYDLEDSERPGQYYVIIRGHSLIEDTAFLVNVPKTVFTEIELSVALEDIKKRNLHEYISDYEKKQNEEI